MLCTQYAPVIFILLITLLRWIDKNRLRNLLYFCLSHIPAHRLGCIGFKVPSGTPSHGDTLILFSETEKRRLSAQSHDVWSLSCEILQLLVWCRGGREESKSWKRQLVVSLIHYEVRGDGIKEHTRLVKSTLASLEQVENENFVVDIVREMLETDPEKRYPCPTLRSSERTHIVGTNSRYLITESGQ
jgi:hypothetical protein